MSATPLSVLDLVPISSGSTAARALRNSMSLAAKAEEFGYARYWVAEHHLNRGVAGTSPAVVLALVGAATSTIRIGSGAVQLGHRTALSTVEEFGLLDAVYPGRVDLGLGRSGGTPRDPALAATSAGVPANLAEGFAPNGLRIPRRYSPGHLIGSPRSEMQRQLLHQPGAQPQDYAEQVDDILALLAGTYRSVGGVEAHVVPGEEAALELWVMGSGGGQSAAVAGERGLRFAANYHVSPATVLEAVNAYRAAFKPSACLRRPYIAVSADVVVARDDANARELAAGYGLWVRSIRKGTGAIEFPTPSEARRHSWEPEDLQLVVDRVETQFVGAPVQVADKLEQLRDATGADELVITTITHGHGDRCASYELLAEEWANR